MSGDLTIALRTAQSGLLTQQQALNVVAQNVANASTDGYSRKIVSLQSQVVAGQGAGVSMAELTRSVDAGLEKSLRLELSTLHGGLVQESYFARIQGVFGSPDNNSSLSHMLAGYQAAVEALALNPGDTLAQMDLVRQAEAVADGFNRLSGTVQDLRAEADQQIGAVVSEINGLLAQIADLNDATVRNTLAGAPPLDLMDARDQAIESLSKLIDIGVYSRDNGDVVIFTAGGQTLVDGEAAVLSHAPAASLAAGTTYSGGGLDGIYVGDPAQGQDITASIKSGELHGLIELRDRILPDLQASLDELAASLQQTVNQVHNRGTTFPGLQSLDGTRQFADAAETFSLDSGGVAIVLFDASGNQAAATTLGALMTSAPVPWTITATASALQTWLQANAGAGSTAAIVDGRLQIDLDDASTLSLAFRDQAGSDPASGAADVTITSDVDNDGNAETYSGFSFFFGLNDFFVAADASSEATGLASVLAVRDDIAASPDLLTSAAVQWDPTRNLSGQYAVSTGDATTVQQLSEAIAGGATFDAAGGLGQVSTTFSDYAALIIGRNSALADANQSLNQVQQDLVDSLSFKADSISGVNLDEELSSLVLYEQAYTAAARVISAVQSMFEALDDLMR